MLISVLMPFKNEESYLSATLDAILSQSETKWELIAVDDNSTDNSFQILKNYEAKDNRIKVLKNPGHGVIEALQLAFSHCHGSMITRQDADDLMPEFKLEELKEILAKEGRGVIVTGHVRYFSESRLGDGFKKYADWLNTLCEKNSHNSQLFKECVICSSNWLMYKEDLEEINAFNDLNYPEDYHLVFKIFEKKLRIVSSPKTTHLWRDHANRASRVSDLYKDQKFFHLKIKYFIKMFGGENINLWGAGPTGKKLAKELLTKNISFNWVTNNPKKIDQQIYGVTLKSFEILKKKPNEKVIISVTQKGALFEIKKFLNEINLKKYFEF